MSTSNVGIGGISHHNTPTALIHRLHLPGCEEKVSVTFHNQNGEEKIFKLNTCGTPIHALKKAQLILQTTQTRQTATDENLLKLAQTTAKKNQLIEYQKQINTILQKIFPGYNFLQETLSDFLTRNNIDPKDCFEAVQCLVYELSSKIETISSSDEFLIQELESIQNVFKNNVLDSVQKLKNPVIELRDFESDIHLLSLEVGKIQDKTKISEKRIDKLQQIFSRCQESLERLISQANDTYYASRVADFKKMSQQAQSNYIDQMIELIEKEKPIEKDPGYITHLHKIKETIDTSTLTEEEKATKKQKLGATYLDYLIKPIERKDVNEYESGYKEYIQQLLEIIEESSLSKEQKKAKLDNLYDLVHARFQTANTCKKEIEDADAIVAYDKLESLTLNIVLKHELTDHFVRTCDQRTIVRFMAEGIEIQKNIAAPDSEEKIRKLMQKFHISVRGNISLKDQLYLMLRQIQKKVYPEMEKSRAFYSFYYTSDYFREVAINLQKPQTKAHLFPLFESSLSIDQCIEKMNSSFTFPVDIDFLKRQSFDDLLHPIIEEMMREGNITSEKLKQLKEEDPNSFSVVKTAIANAYYQSTCFQMATLPPGNYSPEQIKELIKNHIELPREITFGLNNQLPTLMSDFLIHSDKKDTQKFHQFLLDIRALALQNGYFSTSTKPKKYRAEGHFFHVRNRKMQEAMEKLKDKYRDISIGNWIENNQNMTSEELEHLCNLAQIDTTQEDFLDPYTLEKGNLIREQEINEEKQETFKNLCAQYGLLEVNYGTLTETLSFLEEVEEEINRYRLETTIAAVGFEPTTPGL